MARTQYKGFDLPDGVEVPDVPADLRKLVDGGFPARFATVAARNAALAAPPIGTASYIAATASLEVYYGATVGWQPPWNIAWGLIGRTHLLSGTVGNIGTGWSDIPNTTLSVTCVTNRRYDWRYFVSCRSAHEANGVGALQLADLSNTQYHAIEWQKGAVIPIYNHHAYDHGAATGTQSRKLRITMLNGSTTVGWNASTSAPIYVECYDIGPFTLPPA